MENAQDTFWFIIFPIICYVGSAILLAYIAGRKNRNKLAWGLIGGLGLLPALIILLILPRLNPQEDTQTKEQAELASALPDTFIDSDKEKEYFVEETRHTKSFEASIEDIVKDFKNGRLKGDYSVRKTVDGEYRWFTVAELCKTFKEKRR